MHTQDDTYDIPKRRRESRNEHRDSGRGIIFKISRGVIRVCVIARMAIMGRGWDAHCTRSGSQNGKGVITVMARAAEYDKCFTTGGHHSRAKSRGAGG